MRQVCTLDNYSPRSSLSVLYLFNKNLLSQLEHLHKSLTGQAYHVSTNLHSCFHGAYTLALCHGAYTRVTGSQLVGDLNSRLRDGIVSVGHGTEDLGHVSQLRNLV